MSVIFKHIGFLTFLLLPACVIHTTTPDKSKQYHLLNTYNSQPVLPEIPFTNWEYIIPCERLIDIEKEFEKARSCIRNSSTLSENQLVQLETLSEPKCYIIQIDSPDIRQDGLTNNLVFKYFGVLPFENVVGFYQSTKTRMFIVENLDMDRIYRHEAQHYIFDQLGLETPGENLHSHKLWNLCQSRYYFKSNKVRRIEDALINP